MGIRRVTGSMISVIRVEGSFFKSTSGASKFISGKDMVKNAAKSEIVHFNSRCDNVPVFTSGGVRLACADSFRYLGMLFTKQRNPQATAEYTCAPFLAGFRRSRQFSTEHHLTDRPHTMLWLTEAYALPACMHACQIWGTRCMKEGAEMDSPLQTMHCAY
eukprot:1155364-Pelagomonas_calceolata.AAC.7